MMHLAESISGDIIQFLWYRKLAIQQQEVMKKQKMYDFQFTTLLQQVFYKKLVMLFEKMNSSSSSSLRLCQSSFLIQRHAMKNAY